MTRGHRRIHGVMWVVLAPALIVLLVFVLRSGFSSRVAATPPASPIVGERP